MNLASIRIAARRLLPALVFVAFALTSGCGGDDDGATCDSSGDCADGQACNVALGRCGTACESTPRDCASANLLCHGLLGVCVECETEADCDFVDPDFVCEATQCVLRTTCTTSRTCNGQVCNELLGYCVDCNDDRDCLVGTACRPTTHTCEEVVVPETCISDVQCSAMGLVCNEVAEQCVECVVDADCGTDGNCLADLTCE